MTTWEEIVFLIRGTHKNFDLIEENDTGIPSLIRTGDLLMRKINITKFYHVGIYCGIYVIEFTAPENLTLNEYISSSSSSTGKSGTVSMKSVKTFIADKPYRVLCPRMAIPENFSDLVHDAMNYAGIYHPLTNNCLHFALRLLGLKPGPVPRRLPGERDEISMDDLEERAALTGSQQHGNNVNLTH